MSSFFMPFISYAPASLGEAEAMKELAESFVRNPATGETIQIPAAKTVKTTAGSGLKDAANS